MMRLVSFVFALLALSFITVNGASVGHRMKRESCGVMMVRTSNCSNHGYCVSDNIGPHCVCYQGWGGHLCQNVINGRPQGGNSPLTNGDGDDGNDGDGGDDGDDGDDSTTDQPAAQVTEEEARESEGTTQGIQEQTTADRDDGSEDDDNDDDDDDDDDEMMRTERPRPTQGDGDGDGAVGGVVSEDDRLAILCDDLYAQTNTCSNRQGHCSVDSIGAFCQCNAGYLGIACQYRAENVAGVLEAIVNMMRDPHYRVIGGSFP